MRRGPHGPHGHRIIGEFGLAQLSEVMEEGIHIGYRITCRRHVDDDDPTKQCEKCITMGKTGERLDERECILRLKRWFIAGANAVNEDEWRRKDNARMRTEGHMKYGKRRLQELASDNSERNPLYGVLEDELDHWMTTIVP